MMQIIKRERQLNLEERETLMDLVDSVDLMGKVACYILLDNREQAEHYYLSGKLVATDDSTRFGDDESREFNDCSC